MLHCVSSSISSCIFVIFFFFVSIFVIVWQFVAGFFSQYIASFVPHEKRITREDNPKYLLISIFLSMNPTKTTKIRTIFFNSNYFRISCVFICVCFSFQFPSPTNEKKKEHESEDKKLDFSQIRRYSHVSNNLLTCNFLLLLIFNTMHKHIWWISKHK